MAAQNELEIKVQVDKESYDETMRKIQKLHDLKPRPWGIWWQRSKYTFWIVCYITIILAFAGEAWDNIKTAFWWMFGA